MSIAAPEGRFNSIDSGDAAIHIWAMHVAPPNNSRATAEATQDAWVRLQQVFAADPALAGASVDRALHLVPGKRALFAGTFNEQRVVYRLYLDAGEIARAGAQWRELQRADALLGLGPYRVNAPVHFAATGDLIVVGEVAGQPLMKAMWEMPRDDRLPLLHDSVQWLRAYTVSTERWADADLDRWIARVRPRADRQEEDVLREIEAKMLLAMEAIADGLGPVQWRVAVSHGDFHPNNLMHTGDVLTAIDTGGPGAIPIYKDMARYLVHFARRRMQLSGARRFGVDRLTFDAFCDTFALDDVERMRLLPFMIAVDAFQRIPRRGLREKEIGQARKIYRGLLADLKA